MPKRPDDLPEFADADRISDRITSIAKEEIHNNVSPLQILAGQMLAMLGLLNTAPQPRPGALDILEHALELCLTEILRVPKP